MDTESQISFNNCPICFNPMDEITKCTINCSHIFCKDCIHKWLDKNKVSCPQCRDEITSYQNNNHMNYIVKVNIPNEVHQNIVRLNNELNKKILLMRCFLMCNFIYLIYSLYDININTEQRNYYKQLYDNCTRVSFMKESNCNNQLDALINQFSSYSKIGVLIQEKLYECAFPIYFIDKCISSIFP